MLLLCIAPCYTELSLFPIAAYKFYHLQFREDETEAQRGYVSGLWSPSRARTEVEPGTAKDGENKASAGDTQLPSQRELPLLLAGPSLAVRVPSPAAQGRATETRPGRRQRSGTGLQPPPRRSLSKVEAGCRQTRRWCETCPGERARICLSTTMYKLGSWCASVVPGLLC